MTVQHDPSDVSKSINISDKPPEDWINPPKENSGEDVYDQFFTSLSDEEKVQLVKLPYRVGLFLSESDQTGGDDADEAERIVLHSIIQSFAEDYCKCELVQRVMTQTMKYKSQWERWGEDLEEVPIECKTVVWLMQKHGIDEKDSQSVRYTLLEIAVSVAKAFCEEENEEQEQSAVKKILSLFQGKNKQIEIEGLRNISKDEKIALKVLEKYLSASLDVVL